MNVVRSTDSINSDDISYLMLRTSLVNYKKSPVKLSAAELTLLKRQVIKEYEIQNQILSSNEALDVHIPEVILNTAVKEVQGRYGDDDEFLADIEANGMSQQGFRSALARELKVDAVLGRVSANAVSISDMDVMIYYHLHLDRFKLPETRTVRHILVTINADYEENQRDAAFIRLTTIRRRLIKKAMRFSEQALKHSECPTAMNGGLLGRVCPGELYPELDEVLFSMQEGTISEVIESEMGFHILLCEEIHAAGTATLAETRTKIQELLKDRARRMCQKAWLNQLLKTE